MWPSKGGDIKINRHLGMSFKKKKHIKQVATNYSLSWILFSNDGQE